ncbi:MAG: sugar-binding protein [Gemmataceae bacterium]|nr:sugar-binding protein [Gemmataceae bacterium]MDW8266662.1 sugar-binding protein [Gemmataceae bacterium]
MNRRDLLGIGCLALLLSSCGSRAPSQPLVGFVSNNTAEFWTIAEAGTRKAAEEFDVRVEFRRPQNGTAAEQREILEDLRIKGARAVAISVNDPVNQVGLIDSLAAHIPVITQDNDAPGSKRTCYIGTNNYEAGRDVGKLVKEVMPQGGTIAIFVGKPDPLNARLRRQGVLDELAGQRDAAGPVYGKYRLLDTFYDHVDTRKAKDNAADALTRLRDEPNVCLIGLWAYNPPAILSAVKDANRAGQVHIVGFDEAENTLLGIKEGTVYGTVVQQPYRFGYESVKLMAALVRGERPPLPEDGIVYIPHLVIRKENVEQFHRELNALLGK